MVVREFMSAKLVTIGPEESAESARKLMSRHRIRHLVVTDKDLFLGVLSERDLFGARSEAATVREILPASQPTVSPETPLEDAAALMARLRLDAIGVTEGRRPVGILTSTDALRALAELAGAGQPSVRLVVETQGKPDAEKEVRRTVRELHGEIKWLHRRGRTLYVSLEPRHADEIADAIEQKGLEVRAVVLPGRGTASSSSRRPRAARGPSARPGEPEKPRRKLPRDRVR
ncbi:MAG: hypothetical protein KatS3mg076_2514 [Candidatus Binatia bacterium]|nr:MAG: hypothetical protein KatS3mg076_2514 [Candidatus Binatia bacterium]